jgi:hypothetical protein
VNIPALLISTAMGAAFFGAASVYYYQPAFIKVDFAQFSVLNTDHAKARAAVSRLLINPASAQFDQLRSVEVETAKYVCGNVNAKENSGSYAGNRAFVYTIAIDFARIDDDGRIAQRHAPFTACPLSEEEKVAQRKLPISPATLSVLKTIQKNIPASSDPSTLSTLASQMSAGGRSSSGTSMEQELGQMGDRSGSGGQQEANSGNKQAAPDEESKWRGDRPPVAWPMFPRNHPLGRPTVNRTAAEAIALTKGVEDRWEQSKSLNAKVRPSSEEIKEAYRALLAIDRKNDEFPQAWAAFVRLRKIDREAGQT